MKFQRSEELFERAQRRISGGVNSPSRSYAAVGGGAPAFIARGEGAYLYDVDGNRYIDYLAAYGAMILGHAHPKVVEAVRQAITKGSVYGAPTEGEVRMAEAIHRAIPQMEMVRFTASGTEAVMTALRVARGYTGRDKILKFEGCYHGHGDSLLIKAGSGVATLGLPDSPGVPESIAKNTITVPYNDLESVRLAFQEFGDDLAAVIVEPVAGNMGVVPPNEGFLTELRNLTHENGTILIFDEVMTGFRVGFNCAQGYFGVTPDMTCLGKVIGGGLPVGAFGGKREIMQQVAPSGSIYQAGTLSGNPLAMRAGYETLSRLTEESYDVFIERGDQLEKGFREAATKYNIPHTVNRAGSMIGFFFTNEDVVDFDSAKTSDTELFADYYRLMAEEGIFLPPSQFEGMFLSTAHTEEHIAKTVEAFHTVFAKLAR